MKTYKIVRKYFDANYQDEIVKEGVSLEEAKEHCTDDDSSSESCYTLISIERTRIKGKWFDCYYAES